MSRQMMNTGTVHVAFGSNIDPATNLQRALESLASMMPVEAVSPVYASAPVDADGGEFLNAVAAVTWPRHQRALADLKDWLTATETSQGRTTEPDLDPGCRSSRWLARTIDLDILLAGNLVAHYGHRPWQVPHPDIPRFAHVAIPLAAVAPGYHPVTGQALAQIAADLRPTTALRTVEVTGWRLP